MNPKLDMVLENDEQENETEESLSEEDQILEDLALREILVDERKGINRQVMDITTRLKGVIPATDSMDDGYRVGDWKVTNQEVITRRILTDRERFLEAVMPTLLTYKDTTVEEAMETAGRIWDAVRRRTTSQRFVQRRVPPED